MRPLHWHNGVADAEGSDQENADSFSNNAEIGLTFATTECDIIQQRTALVN